MKINASAHVFLIGINHNDPLGRAKVVKLLKEAKQKGFVPDVIGVEWKEEIAKKLILMRSDMEQLIMERWPRTEKREAKTIADTIAYEADAHLEVYPQLEIIWLDEQREITEALRQRIDTYCIDRKNIYANHVPSECDQLCVSTLSSSIGLVENANFAPSIRDQLFADALLAAIENGKKQIVCIVGADHTNIEMPGSFANRIFAAGHEVKVIDARKEYLCYDLLFSR